MRTCGFCHERPGWSAWLRTRPSLIRAFACPACHERLKEKADIRSGRGEDAGPQILRLGDGEVWTSYGTDYWFREPPHAAAVAFRVPGEGAGGQAIPVDRPVNPIVFPSPRPKRTSATEHIILRT